MRVNLILALGLGLASVFAVYEYHIDSGYSSDIAFVTTQYHEIKAPVSGRLLEAVPDDYQVYSSGAQLFTIDASDVISESVSQFELDVDFAVKQKKSLTERLDSQRQEQQIAMGEREINNNKINYLTIEAQRVRSLAKGNTISQREFDFVSHELEQAELMEKVLQSKIRLAEHEVKHIESLIDEQNTVIAKAKQKRDDLIKKMKFYQVTAPTTVSVVKVRHGTGDYVQEGDTLGVAFNPEDIYVDAYYPETDIPKISVGMAVDVKINAINDTVKGTISAISTVGGHALNLVPQNYQSGHFLPLTYRFGVRVKLTQPTIHIKPGMTADVTFNHPSP